MSERPDDFTADDAERLLAGELPDLDSSPALTNLSNVFTAARGPADHGELAQRASVLAAFSAARLAPRHAAPTDNRRRALTRRTVGILCIATGGSLSAALAAGAVGNPFTSPVTVDRPPATTSLPATTDVTPTATGVVGPLDPIADAPPPISTSIGKDRTASATSAAAPPPLSDTTDRPTRVDPSATAPAQTPAVTAPGHTQQTPAVTAPGHTQQTPSVTAPGHTQQTPSATAP